MVIDVALPAVLIIISAAILTGNFAATSFFRRCGLGFTARYLCGALIGGLGVALLVGLSSYHTIAALILLLIFLAAMAMRAGAGGIAAANMITAAALVPVAMVS